MNESNLEIRKQKQIFERNNPNGKCRFSEASIGDSHHIGLAQARRCWRP